MDLSRVLVLAPHTDDAELGCGGTIARLIDEGREVHVAAFSTAEESLPPGSAPSTLRDEFEEAMRILEVPSPNTIVYQYPVRRLAAYRQEVLDELIKLRTRIQPSVVFVPSGSDLHQDHQVLHAEGLRAFRELTLWGYELPWNQVSFDAQAFVRLTRRHLEKKWEALRAYRSQLDLRRPYFTWEFQESLARVRGTQMKVEYAEAFDVVRVLV